MVSDELTKDPELFNTAPSKCPVHRHGCLQLRIGMILWDIIRSLAREILLQAPADLSVSFIAAIESMDSLPIGQR